MKSFIRGSLFIESAIFALYGLGLIFFPQGLHQLLSPAAYDPATSGIIAASMLGFAMIFLVEAQDPVPQRVHAIAVALGLVGLAFVLGIINGAWINANGFTLFGMTMTLGMSIYLFILQSESVNASVSRATTTTSASTPARKPAKAATKKAKPATKKTSSKKKTAKKKAKKTAKKRR